MLRSRRTIPALLCPLLLSLCGCQTESPSSEQAAPQRVTIAVTSYPLLAMTQRMAESAADVELVVQGPSTSPQWKPTAEAVQSMQSATRILISGGDHEPWLQRVTVPRSRLIDTADGYYSEFIRIPDATVHQHGPDGSHSHPGVVWATWLDPQLALSQMERTRDVLLQLLPDAAGDIRQAADGMAEEFRQLDERLNQLAASSSDAKIMVLGDAPVYQYLTQRLGWDLKYIHLPSHGPLTEDERASLTNAIAEHQPDVVWVQTTHAEERDSLKENHDVRFVLIDLCEKQAKGRSLIERMMQNLDRIQAALPIHHLESSPGGH